MLGDEAQVLFVQGRPVGSHVRFVVSSISADKQFEAVPHFHDILGHFRVTAFLAKHLSCVKLVQDDPALAVPKCTVGDRLHRTGFVGYNV